MDMEEKIRKIWDFYHHLVMPILICMDNSFFNLFLGWIHLASPARN